MNFVIPKEVREIGDKLMRSGYRAYLVGGCVRDLLLGELGLSRAEGPKDWDIATDAHPEEIQKIFPDSVYENKFGTVLVKLEPLINADENADERGLLYEDLTYKLRGMFFAVYNKLCSVHKEIVYQNALEEELKKNGVNFSREKEISVVYEDKKVGVYRPDFIVDDKIIIEVKALPFLGKLEEKQIWHYLKGSEYKLALLVNFGGKTIDIQRIVYDLKRQGDFISENRRLDRRKSALNVVEITTFRVEGKYTDKRHPDEIKFAKTIEEDLARRDFTINAMALNLNSKHEVPTSSSPDGVEDPRFHREMLDEIGISNFEFRISDFTVVDPYGGGGDLKNKIIRAVGDPKERFSEDALRLLRAVRFYSQFGFKIEKKTEDAIKSGAKFLKFIAYERIRDEFTKLIMSDGAADGVFKLEEVGLLQYILPELREGIGCEQNRHHIYTVFEHNVRALEYAAKKNYSLEIRLASLLHDIGKPQTKCGRGENSTFYNHEMVSARMAKQALMRLKFSNEIIEKVRHLVRYHMFYYNVGEVSEAGVRRFIARVGVENIDDIMKVREADRIGSRVPKAFPYKLRHLLFMIEKVRHDPVHPKMLAVRGDDVMEILKIQPGPKVGQILFMLLEEVLDDPTKNTKENLEKRIKDLGKLSDTELKKLSEKAKSKKEEFESGIEQEMKKKYYVK